MPDAGINIGLLPFLLIGLSYAAVLLFSPRTARSWYVRSQEASAFRVDPKSEALENLTLRAWGVTLYVVFLLLGYLAW